MHRFRYLACALALAAAACSNSSTINTTTPPLLTIDFTSDTYGPLTPNGSQTFAFASTAAGQVGVTLVALDPDGPNGAVVGLELGVWDGNNCQRIVHNDRVGIGGAAVVANATAAGSLCAGILDATGTLPGPETFDIQVTHP